MILYLTLITSYCTQYFIVCQCNSYLTANKQTCVQQLGMGWETINSRRFQAITIDAIILNMHEYVLFS